MKKTAIVGCIGFLKQRNVEIKLSHKSWVESGLLNGDNHYDEKWSRSIAVGSKGFIDNVKSLMGGLALGRKKTEAGESYQLREAQIPYGDDFGARKIEIAPENACFWD